MRDRSKIELPKLEFFKVSSSALEIAPGRSKRAWMDATPDRFAYRCTPLTIANESGWELRTPVGFWATWNGHDEKDAIFIEPDGEERSCLELVSSHFGSGVLTFHVGWLLRTSAGWAISARGAPNNPKDGIIALEGVVETDWLPFTFTVNWRFTRPGQVYFAKGDPVCFITIVPHAVLDQVEPIIRNINEDPKLDEAYSAWKKSRNDFNRGLESNEPAVVEAGWERKYLTGKGAPPKGFHIRKRKLKGPADSFKK